MHPCGRGIRHLVLTAPRTHTLPRAHPATHPQLASCHHHEPRPPLAFCRQSSIPLVRNSDTDRLYRHRLNQFSGIRKCSRFSRTQPLCMLGYSGRRIRKEVLTDRNPWHTWQICTKGPVIWDLFPNLILERNVSGMIEFCASKVPQDCESAAGWCTKDYVVAQEGVGTLHKLMSESFFFHRQSFGFLEHKAKLVKELNPVFRNSYGAPNQSTDDPHVGEWTNVRFFLSRHSPQSLLQYSVDQLISLIEPISSSVVLCFLY